MDLSGIPYAELHSDRDARLVDPSEVDRLLSTLDTTGATDLVVLSHGWNNDEAEARRLYAALAARIAEVRPRVAGLADPADRRLALLGVLWPSKRFADAELIPGGAAAVPAGPSDAELRRELTALAALVGRPVPVGALAAVPQVDERATARRALADAVRELVEPAADPDDEETPPKLFAVDGEELYQRFARPTLVLPPGRTTGGAARVGTTATGGAAGFRLPAGLRNAARNLLNFGTYYAMKGRAGRVGFEAVAPVLGRLAAERPGVRLHLAGHSFGGRVVTAAATGGDGPAVPVTSLTLLQAAFSHYGFAAGWEPGRDGLFRRCLGPGRVGGPVLVTHTGNDKAVGIAYALASRAAGQVAAAVGDAQDRYGGIGRNGAQKTPEAVQRELLDVGGDYRLAAGTVHNLLADRFVSGHSDVTGPQVAYALLIGVAG
jgi:hypothetical protein